jgi:hypothetical protein
LNPDLPVVDVDAEAASGADDTASKKSKGKAKG